MNDGLESSFVSVGVSDVIGVPYGDDIIASYNVFDNIVKYKVLAYKYFFELIVTLLTSIYI